MTIHLPNYRKAPKDRHVIKKTTPATLKPAKMEDEPKTVKQQQLNNKTPDEQTSSTNIVQKTSGNLKKLSEIYLKIVLDKNIEDPCKSSQDSPKHDEKL